MAKGTSWNARETVTVSGTAGGLTATGEGISIAGQRVALITVEVAQMRFTLDGTTATTSIGHIANVGDEINLDTAETLADFSAIRTGGTSAIIECTYGY